MLGQNISNRWSAETFPRSRWVKKFNLQMTFMFIHFSHFANPPKCILDTADTQKILDVFYIYFFGQLFVEIKLKKLSILTYEFVSNFVARYWHKMVTTPYPRYSLWLSNPPDQHEYWPFLPGLYQKMWCEEFLLYIDQALIGSSRFGHVWVFVNYVLQHNV